MFGDLDYIDCEHCGSIFSAAAYFVDLMRIVDQYITEPNQTSISEARGLTLNQRRPDLAEIELDSKIKLARSIVVRQEKHSYINSL